MPRENWDSGGLRMKADQGPIARPTPVVARTRAEWREGLRPGAVDWTGPGLSRAMVHYY